jgi:hypothetical protein
LPISLKVYKVTKCLIRDESVWICFKLLFTKLMHFVLIYLAHNSYLIRKQLHIKPLCFIFPIQTHALAKATRQNFLTMEIALHFGIAKILIHIRFAVQKVKAMMLLEAVSIILYARTYALTSTDPVCCFCS